MAQPDKYELDIHDEELVGSLTSKFGLSKEQAEELVVQIVLPWIKEQHYWGGKYDYLLESTISREEV